MLGVGGEGVREGREGGVSARQVSEVEVGQDEVEVMLCNDGHLGKSRIFQTEVRAEPCWGYGGGEGGCQVNAC